MSRVLPPCGGLAHMQFAIWKAGQIKRLLCIQTLVVSDTRQSLWVTYHFAGRDPIE